MTSDGEVFFIPVPLPAMLLWFTSAPVEKSVPLR